MSARDIATRKAHGVWYAWTEPFCVGLHPGKTKREAIEAARRRYRRGVEGERADLRIVDRLIDRRKRTRHPLILAVAEAVREWKAIA